MSQVRLKIVCVAGRPWNPLWDSLMSSFSVLLVHPVSRKQNWIPVCKGREKTNCHSWLRVALKCLQLLMSDGENDTNHRRFL
ncbi:Hypothetical protein NTJ_14612 [Nesidiocoris tenuis]|nr:Hypothetical protein NTJ_14612 [Nesidiocoris tenuis]